MCLGHGLRLLASLIELTLWKFSYYGWNYPRSHKVDHSFARQKKKKKKPERSLRENERYIPKMQKILTSLWQKKEPFSKMEEGPGISWMEVKFCFRARRPSTLVNVLAWLYWRRRQAMFKSMMRRRLYVATIGVIITFSFPSVFHTCCTPPNSNKGIKSFPWLTQLATFVKLIRLILIQTTTLFSSWPIG